MIINGIELEDIDITEMGTLKKYEDAHKRVVEVAEKTKKLKEPVQMIKQQCNAVFNFFNSLFGEGTDKKVFGDKVSLKVCVKAFAEFNEYVAKDIQETNEMVNKYSPNRASRRA